jgi:hypothetical protein
MRLVENLMWAALAVGLIAVAASYTQSGSPLTFFLILPPLAFWLFGWRKMWDSAVNVAFVLTFLLLGVAAFRQHDPTLLLSATLGTFCAWDLHAFGRRLAQHNATPDHATLIRRHLQTLLTVIIITLVIALIIFNATLDIGLFWSLLLGGVLVVGVSQAIRFLRESDL